MILRTCAIRRYQPINPKADSNCAQLSGLAASLLRHLTECTLTESALNEATRAFSQR